jgi:hypothetical protein
LLEFAGVVETIKSNSTTDSAWRLDTSTDERLNDVCANVEWKGHLP